MGAGADLRGDAFPQGFDPLPTQRVPLLNYFEISILVTEPKIFLKVPLAPIYTYLKGAARAEKARFLGQNFPTIFWPVFAYGAKNLTKTVFLMLWESWENQFGRPIKKGRQNF